MSASNPYFQLQTPTATEQSYFRPDRLPRPINFGYVSQNAPLPVVTQQPMDVQVADPQDPTQAAAQLAKAAPQFTMPDITRVEFGAADRGVVGDLLRIANDQPAQQLTGITKEYALRKLADWQYPIDPGALDADGWAALLATHATDPNPLTLLGG